MQCSQEYLKTIIDYMMDQHYDMWDMMKRGDLIEDISVTRLNAGIQCLDQYIPTIGMYIVDTENNQNHETLTSSHVLRNGLTIRCLVLNDEPYTIRRHTIPKTMYCITEFPIRYFDDIEINYTLCPDDISRSSWGGACLVTLDSNKLKLNKLHKQNVKHSIRNVMRNDKKIMIEYLYIIITYVDTKYLLVSEYMTEPIKYDIDNEKTVFIKRIKSGKYLDPYDRFDDKVIQEIAMDQGVDINNVLCI